MAYQEPGVHPKGCNVPSREFCVTRQVSVAARPMNTACGTLMLMATAADLVTPLNPCPHARTHAASMSAFAAVRALGPVLGGMLPSTQHDTISNNVVSVRRIWASHFGIEAHCRKLKANRSSIRGRNNYRSQNQHLLVIQIDPK